METCHLMHLWLSSFYVLIMFSLCLSIHLSHPELPPPSLTLTPNTRQMFRGEHFTVQCPKTNSSGWILKYLPQGRGVKTKDFPADMCSPRWGPSMCIFTASNKSSGLYWCVGAEGRSNAVYIIANCEFCIIMQLKTPEKLGEKIQKKEKANYGLNREWGLYLKQTSELRSMCEAVCLLIMSTVLSHRWCHHLANSCLPCARGW